MAAARSIASLTLCFGLVSIPIRLYSATDSGASVRFHLLAPDGSRLKQQYVSEQTGKVVPRDQMMKGYEVEKDQFVLFQPDELKRLEETASHVIDIVAFIPEGAVDPLYYDKAYLLAPDKRGGKPYALLVAAMRESGQCALARWAWRARQHVVQVRATEDGLVLQQLLYADEVRSLKDLAIEPVEVAPSELKLALQLIDQISTDRYDPTAFEDEERKRVLAAIDEKIAGRQVVASARGEDAPQGGQVVDLMAALRASLGKPTAAPREAAPPARKAAGAEAGNVTPLDAGARKAPKRAARTPAPEAAPAPRSRARK